MSSALRSAILHKHGDAWQAQMFTTDYQAVKVIAYSCGRVLVQYMDRPRVKVGGRKGEHLILIPEWAWLKPEALIWD
jgi:hypothetical protein